MNRLRRVIYSLSSMFMSATVVQAAPFTEREERLPAWLSARVGVPPVLDDGIVIDWSMERTSDLTPDEFARKWAAVQPYPDHPDRSLLELHQRLINKRERLEATIWFKGPGLWACIERHENGYSFDCGGLEDSRWMLSRQGKGGQLTAIHASQPFPSIYNVSGFADMTRERVGVLLYGGLSNLPHGCTVQSVKETSSRWEAVLADEIGHRVFRVGGSWHGEAVPVVESLKTESKLDGATLETTTFESYSAEHPSVPSWPARVVVRRGDGVIETYLVHSVRRGGQAELEQAARVPTAPDGVRLLDFSSPASTSWAGYADAPRMTWYRRAGVDRFDVDEAAAAAVAGGTTGEGAGVRGEHWRSQLVATGFAVVVLAGIPFALSRWRRFKEIQR